MERWRFSWRAAMAWALSALVAGAYYGMSLSICNVLISPSEMTEFGISSAVLIVAGFAVFLVYGGIPELISSAAWRPLKWWPRPWAEMALCAAAVLLTTHVFGVDITFDNDGQDVPASSNAVAFYGIHIAPLIAGLAAPYLYWLLAKPQRG